MNIKSKLIHALGGHTDLETELLIRYSQPFISNFGAFTRIIAHDDDGIQFAKEEVACNIANDLLSYDLIDFSVDGDYMYGKIKIYDPSVQSESNKQYHNVN